MVKKKKSAQGVSTPPQRISLCMIVKNEEAFLTQCFDSVKEHVDEIIVVDTGSMDRTVEIAKSYGAKVYHHPWENNFSKHRNQSISYATGDWILILDADEELDAKTGHLLRKAVQEAPTPVIALNVRSYLENASAYTEGSSPRLFKNGLGIHYRGYVHNQLTFTGKRSTDYPIVIWHYGYDLSPEQIKAKQERSLALLKKQIKEFPDDLPTRHHLAMTWLACKEYEKAYEEAKRTLGMRRTQGIEDTNFAWTYFIAVSSLINLERMDEAETLAYEGLQCFDKAVDMHHCLVQIKFVKKDYGKVLEHGEEFFRLCEELQEDFSQFQSFQFETVHREWIVYRAMGYAKIFLGNDDAGVDLLTEGLKTAPARDADTLRQEIGLNLIKLEKFARAISFLEHLPRDKREYETGLLELGANYERLGRVDEAVGLYDQIESTFEENTEIPFKKGLLLLKLNRHHEAALAFEKAANKKTDHAEAWINWGLALENQGAQDAAEEKYRTALSIDPDSPKGNLNLGLFYFKQEDYARAREHLEKLAAHYHENLYLALALSRLYVETGEIEAMIGPCENALRCLDLPSDFLIESIPQLSELFLEIAEKLLKGSRFKAFDLALDIALLLGPGRGDALGGVAQSAFDMGEYERAAKVLEAALCIDPKSPENLSLVQAMTDRLGASS